MYLTQRYLDRFSAGTIFDPNKDIIDELKLRIFKISKIVYDPNEQINDKFISVYGSLHALNSAVALIIRSDKNGIGFYAAVRSEENPGLAAETLVSSLRGNFPGINISETYSGNEKRTFLDSLSKSSSIPKSLATVSLIPSERDTDKNNFIQGMEKFLSSMSGIEFNAILLATPVNSGALATRRHGFESLYSQLSPHSKISMSFANSETESVNKGISSSFSNSVNNSVSNSNGSSTSYTVGESRGSSSSFGGSGEGYSFSSGDNYSSSSSYTSGSNFSYTVSQSTGRSDTQGTSSGTSHSTGETDTTTLNFENKSVEVLMERAESQLKRIDLSESYGMWDFCAYFFSDDIAVTVQAANVYKAIMMGQESSVERVHINTWNMGRREEIFKIISCAKHLVHPVTEIPAFDHYEAQTVTPTNMVNGKELPMVLGFPRKSVPGMAVIEMAEFGRAVVFENPERVERTMEFGNIYHMGVPEALRVPMDIDLLSSHCFITGSSGSGKSYATYQLLDNLLSNDVKIMVIEPAKGEYKQVFGGLKGIRIFNTDPEVYKMLRVNPFQFPENLHVLTHIEKLIQIFNASWSLYAAMPAILKDAVVKSYVKCGWDVMNSVWIEGISDHKYPVFSDVLEILPKIINSSDYSADSKGDYKGALLTRVQSMTSGITGLIFEKSEGIADNILFDSNAVIDLSEIGSEETVALLMGILIMRLGEYRQSVRKAGLDLGRDLALKHVTVLEEAHNILKRTNKEQSSEGSNIVGKSVEMISNSIKEMRTYGEGFIIIDQSPMAVDSSAIENTATKIIMNTPARDACEELSSALSLTDEQSRELSRLSTGVAAVFQKGWLTPVLMKIDKWSDKYESKVKRAEPEKIKALRGKLIKELIAQHCAGLFSPMKIRKIIKNSGIDDEKQRDYEDIVAIMSNMLKNGGKGIEAHQVGKLCLMILNCDGLFDVINDTHIYSQKQIENKLDKEPDWFTPKQQKILQERVTAWLNRFRRAIESYADIDETSVFFEAVKCLLLFKSDNGKNISSRYLTIWIYIDEGYVK